MPDSQLTILNDPAIAGRISPATRRVLEERAQPIAAPQYLSVELYATLRRIVETILPQDVIDTDVDVAAVIDQRLMQGKSAGWRFAMLPADGEAYREGLSIAERMLDRISANDADFTLCRMAAGEFDAAEEFALSKWLLMLKTDVVRAWLSHPLTMRRLQLYGFADGVSGRTDGPTDREGWAELQPGQSFPFEQSAAETGA